MKAILILIVLLTLGLGFILVDVFASKPEAFCGIVVDKQYKAESSSNGVGVGVGYGATNSVNTTVIVTSQHENEKFLVMVKTGNGKIVTVNCKSELYYKKEVGQKIDCNAYNGCFTGLTWEMQGVR